MSRRDELALKDYLEHIQQAIQRIQRLIFSVIFQIFLTHILIFRSRLLTVHEMRWRTVILKLI